MYRAEHSRTWVTNYEAVQYFCGGCISLEALRYLPHAVLRKRTVLILIPHCRSLQRSLHALSKRAFRLLVLLVTLVSIADVRRLHIISPT